MKSILFDLESKSWKLSDVTAPAIGKNEALVKITHAGLCGSDMHRINAPTDQQRHIALGHEITGIVVDADRAHGLMGKHVVVNPIINCRECFNCSSTHSQFCEASVNLGKTLSGGFSEYVAAPVSSIYLLPDEVDPKCGVLVDGIAVILNALSKLKGNIPKKVLVIGDGTVSAISLAVLRAKFPEVQLTIAGKNVKNTDFLCDKFQAQSFQANKKDFDVCIETVGRNQNETLNLAINNSAIGANILILGVYPENFQVGLNARSAFYKELSIVGVNSFVTSGNRNDFQDAVNILENNNHLFKELITHELSLEDFSKGVDLMKRKSESGAIKIIFNP